MHCIKCVDYQEKGRAQTPPLSSSKKNPLSRTVEKLKTNRAKRRWKQVLFEEKEKNREDYRKKNEGIFKFKM